MNTFVRLGASYDGRSSEMRLANCKGKEFEDFSVVGELLLLECQSGLH